MGVCVGVRWLLVMLLGWRRRGRRWQIFSGFVNNAQLDDGGRVDWTTIGSDTAHPGLLGLLSDTELVLTGTVHG